MPGGADVPRAPEPTPLLVYDGDCGFCRRLANWAAPKLRRGRIVTSANADPPSQLGLAPDAFECAVYWIDPDGSTYAGHRAIGCGCRDIGGVYGAIGWMIGIPPVSWLAALLYRVVARNRHRFPGVPRRAR